MESFPHPSQGALVAHLLIVRDQDASRAFYKRVFDAEVVREKDPVMLRLYGTWLILNTGGGPTPDKPEVVAVPPENHREFSSILNVRVADIDTAYRTFTERGARFLTPPVQRPQERRCFMTDPDGHLIEVGEFEPSYLAAHRPEGDR
ncbi:VOC family protein [Streptomyces sp. NPDC051776]|uniref:VOC family protein n=1 Tax=Streptomyces sp. NPDC051776 TaxID=3155414 RepID=UPI00342E38D1